MYNQNEKITAEKKLKRWDTYFYSICVAVASKSPCKSRQIGAILVRNKKIVSTGFNGPPVNYPHCLTCPRKDKDLNLVKVSTFALQLMLRATV